MINVFIYDNSWIHRLELKNVVQNYTKDNGIELGIMVSTSQPNKIIGLSRKITGLYLLNINDLEKITNGIAFGLHIRNNDASGSIVFLTAHDIFVTDNPNLAIRSFRNHVEVMSFIAKDSIHYKNEIKNCIALHIRKFK